MFGRKKEDPPVLPVRWDTEGGFTVGEVVRPSAPRRKKLIGRRAVRMPVTLDGARYFAAAAFIEQRDPEVRSYELYDATETGELLCTVASASGGRNGERYQVRDQAGRELGLVCRTPAAKRAVQHGWWLRQPGHPDVVARYHWAKGSARQIAARGRDAAVRGASGLATSVVDSVLYGDAADDTSTARPRKPVTWHADEEAVLTAGDTQGSTLYVPQARWLERRLAFALAVLQQG
ncbi:hypothetical protein MMF93_09870 [Streptomyces tubbatahanensis]|uniref:Uncharacterized protein n=1 Tax=Streptomyces tubbatahanensis TaxID=2923272 RepID=A0ABY3XQU7_9ACTN|nr:hypothetical protein [Streptomyces tubbatahanensis]UNS96784.1 hypothetical protein MMF93_09870 [Streptomyces tubbatahanensis]